MKFLLLLALLVVAYLLFKAHQRKNRRGAQPPDIRSGEDMVRCAQCGVHLPRSESLPAGQSFYCSAEHRALRERAG